MNTESLYLTLDLTIRKISLHFKVTKIFRLLFDKLLSITCGKNLVPWYIKLYMLAIQTDFPHKDLTEFPIFVSQYSNAFPVLPEML